VADIKQFTIISSYPIFAGLGVWYWELVNLASISAPDALYQSDKIKRHRKISRGGLGRNLQRSYLRQQSPLMPISNVFYKTGNMAIKK
jgi:hypothetical protein